MDSITSGNKGTRDRGNKKAGRFSASAHIVPHISGSTLPLSIISKISTNTPGRDIGASYKELIVWQKAMQLCAEVYKLTALFPSSERLGLTSQMRRCSVSIASNIAEGYGRSTRGEYVQFLGHARGSNCELQTQLALAEMLGLQTAKSKDDAERLSADVSRLLNGLINKLKG